MLKTVRIVNTTKLDSPDLLPAAYPGFEGGFMKGGLSASGLLYEVCVRVCGRGDGGGVYYMACV